MWKRSPGAGSKLGGAVPPVAHSCMLENINASDHGPDLPEPKTVEPAKPAGVMGVAKNTTPQPRARQSPATDFSVDDDSSLRPAGGGKAKGKGKSDKGKGKSDKGKGKGDKGGRRQDGSRPRPKGGERTRSPPATRHR